MAETQGKGKELLGQPWWVWAAGAAAIIGGYLYIRNKAKSQGATTGGATTGHAAGPQKIGLTFTDLNHWRMNHEKPVRPKQHHPRGQPSPPPGA